MRSLKEIFEDKIRKRGWIKRSELDALITLPKMEMEKRYEGIIREKVKIIDNQEAQLIKLQNKIYDFPSLLRSYSGPQINALYYEMISTVRQTATLRHYFGIWFKRIKNAAETLDKDLMNDILEENNLSIK
jgi:hypothetical protein